MSFSVVNSIQKYKSEMLSNIPLLFSPLPLPIFSTQYTQHQPPEKPQRTHASTNHPIDCPKFFTASKPLYTSIPPEPDPASLPAREN